MTKPVDEETGALLDEDGVVDEDEEIVEEELEEEEDRELVEDGAGMHSMRNNLASGISSDCYFTTHGCNNRCSTCILHQLHMFSIQKIQCPSTRGD